MSGASASVLGCFRRAEAWRCQADPWKALGDLIARVEAEFPGRLLLGKHDFVVYNSLRLAQPAMMAISFLVLWRLGALHVTSALIATTASSGIVVALGMARSIHRIGFVLPNVRDGLTALWYGVRGQHVEIESRVDAGGPQRTLPAYVVASSVGLYSVATNVSLIIYQLSNTLSALLVPAAARDPERGAVKIVGSLFGSLLIAGVLAVVIGILARPLLSLVYGSQFGRAAFTLRLLLPGAVLFAGSSIVTAGVYAAGRPFLASMSQVLGLVVTVVGLVVFLRGGGITAAALVSTASYATVFATTLIAYKVVTGIPWRGFLPTPSRLRSLMS